MANLGTIAKSNTLYTAVKNPSPYTSVRSGVGYGRTIGTLGISNTLYTAFKNPVPYTNRLAGAGGTKGISSGGGGGVPTRTFSRGGAH